MTEGRELSRAFTQDIITFHEVSVAHCPDDIMRMFTRLLQSISHIKVFNSSFFIYCKVTSSNTSCLEAHAGFFRLLMKGIFDPYVL